MPAMSEKLELDLFCAVVVGAAAIAIAAASSASQ